MAAQCNLAPELSRLFRKVAVEEAGGLPTDTRVFLNLHPAELRDAMFLKNLAAVPEALGGGRQVVLEFHEEAVADAAAMRLLRDQLNALGIGLAYDDFGAGQSRLTELAEAPPDFIKLDKSLVHGLHESPGRQELVRASDAPERRPGHPAHRGRRRNPGGSGGVFDPRLSLRPGLFLRPAAAHSQLSPHPGPGRSHAQDPHAPGRSGPVLAVR